jgi:hypothetical protein
MTTTSPLTFAELLAYLSEIHHGGIRRKIRFIYRRHNYTFIKGKGKAIPLQAWTSP